jgi:hypothetical protein
MSTSSGVSRRIQQCVQHIQQQDWEGALVNLFPALDKTAKRPRPKAGVGERIKAFLEEEESLISAVATGNVFKGIQTERQRRGTKPAPRRRLQVSSNGRSSNPLVI